MNDPAALRHLVEAAARDLGFEVVGVTRAEAAPGAADGLAAFLAAGSQGDMAWLADPRRADPRLLWPDARSAIVLGMNYGPDHDPRAVLAARERAAISVYAQGEDYHEVIKSRLKAVARALLAAAGEGADVKVFVDTAALMEKPLAARAGLGWQGKHTNLVSRERGSWLFLGVILTTLDLVPDAAETDHCGSCRACLDACPTAAFPAPYRLDARRCISYLTIEHKGPIDRALRPLIGNRVYGCDDCLAACPWNKFAEAGREARLAARDDLKSPALAELAELDDAGFRARFRKSPVNRVGRDRFLRNVLIAIGNSGVPGLAEVARRRLDDASPLVRGAAVWALARLTGEQAFAGLRALHLPGESDAQVRAEWTADAQEAENCLWAGQNTA